MAMPTGPLSSNWEFLKKRLDASNPPKRKTAPVSVASTSDIKPLTKRRKRQRSDTPDAPATTIKPKEFRKINSHTLRKRMSATQHLVSDDESDGGVSLALWAEDNDIPAEDLARAYKLPLAATKVPVGVLATVKASSSDAAATTAVATGIEPTGLSANKTEIGRYVAVDCEMVGVGEGDHERSALARVSIVNFHGHCLFDAFVKPKEKVTDWRTWVSGVSPKDMINAITFEEAQQKVAEIFKDRILVGHAIKNDLDCLLVSHPKRDIRDTSKHVSFRKYSKGRTPGLKKLAKEVLGIGIQGGSHSSIEDARACMLLYRRFKDDFERENQIRFPNHAKKSSGDKKQKRNK